MPAYSRSFMEEDEELDNLEIEQRLDNEEPELTKEEITWKKRYGDLRRLQQQTATDLKIMKKQLEDTASARFSMPNPNDERALDEWRQNYPDIANIVTVLASKEAKKQMEKVDQRLAQFEEDKQKDAIETAVRKLSDAHPDFFDNIRLDPEFDAWIRSKSKRMQDALFSDESVTDWQSAADVIALYKMEKGITEAPKKKNRDDQRRQTVMDVPTRQRGPSLNNNIGDYTFTESQIGNMKDWEYEQNEEKINDAMKKGKVFMDISGGAR